MLDVGCGNSTLRADLFRAGYVTADVSVYIYMNIDEMSVFIQIPFVYTYDIDTYAFYVPL